MKFKNRGRPDKSLSLFLRKSLPKIILALTTTVSLNAAATKKRSLKYVESSCVGVCYQKDDLTKLLGQAKKTPKFYIPGEATLGVLEVALKSDEDQKNPSTSKIQPKEFLPLFPVKPEKYKDPLAPIETPSPVEITPPPQKETEEEPLKLPPLEVQETTPPPTTQPIIEEVEEEEEEEFVPIKAPPPPEAPIVKTITPISENPSKNQGYLINFSNVSVAEFIRFISRITNKNFIFNDEELDFNVTIISEEPTTIDQILASLMHELRIHNLSLIEEGNNLIIHSNNTVNAPGTIIPRPPGEIIPPDVQLVTRVFRLETLQASKASGIIKPLLSEQSIIESVDETGFLIVTDLKINVDGIAELLYEIDTSSVSPEVNSFSPRYITVNTLSTLGKQIFTSGEDDDTIRFIPFSEARVIFIMAPPALAKKIIKFFRELDIDVGKQTGRAQRSASPGSYSQGSYSQGSPEYEEDIVPDVDFIQKLIEQKLNEDTLELQDKLQSFQKKYAVDGLDDENQALSPEEKSRIENERLEDKKEKDRQEKKPKIDIAKILQERFGSPKPLLPGGLPLGHVKNTEFELYKLHYRKGEQIQVALQQIADSMIQTQNNPNESSNELLTAISSTQWIESSNALVYTGTAEANTKLRALIKDLDVANQQVLIEMLLLDTSIEDSLNFGVNWGTAFGGPNAGGAQAFTTGGSPLFAGISENSTSSGVSTLNASNLAASTGFNLGVIGRNIDFNGLTFSTMGGLVSAIHNTSNSKVALNQKIVVEENHTAEIFVGINFPFRGQSLSNEFGTVITENFEYRDVGAKMQVTPIVNANGIITLEINQELSTIASGGAGSITTTIFEETGGAAVTRKSNSSTTLFVPDGYFVIMSGNIQDEKEKSRDQIPCLGGVPVIGGLFSQKDNRDIKRALMIFIRPKLMNTKDVMVDETRREQDMFDQKTQEPDFWKYEVDEALDLLNISDPHCPR
ncbi:hypothetical protein N9Y92_01250 [Chlamydiales bacterium]|nr:hypothetical protein [Chlamydiales bacterium]